MEIYMSNLGLRLIIVCSLITVGWCYRSSGHHYDQHVPFGSMQYGNQNNANCPMLQPFPPNAAKVTDNLPYECLPSYLRNRNAVLDDDDGTTEWAAGSKPDYSSVDALFVTERTIIHPEGSMEDRISNLIKNWDKELRHKRNSKQWVTVVPDNYFMVNNGERLSLAEIFQIGSYNMFLGRSEFYSRDYINSSTADNTFQTALGSGFAIEVLEVFSPPPRVSFKFRHWGHMTGALRCPMRNGTWLNVPPHGRKVEFFGNSVLHVNEKYQIMSVENSFRGDALMEQMVLGTGVGTRTGTLNGNGGVEPNRGSGAWFW
ncbi:pathogen-related protein-like [Bradysia coprophila]|uniref:pathogen-related protein-like n=1 Tax=Bradysia coprophila TaxID=38358 RepID=UPI00187DA577|nr:pathogen-related protein-like [Bradysia coprophila]